MEVEKIRAAHDYNDILFDDVNYYIEKTNEVNEKFSKDNTENILEEIYMLKSVNIPKNDPRLKHKIIEEVNTIVNQYGDVIEGNKTNQINQLYGIYDETNVNGVDDIDFKKIDIEKQLETIRTNIINRIITYFNFENKNNTMYWEKSSQVEEIVKREITLDKIQFISQQIESIYLETLEMMKTHQEKFNNDFLNKNMSPTK